MSVFCPRCGDPHNEGQCPLDAKGAGKGAADNLLLGGSATGKTWQMPPEALRAAGGSGDEKAGDGGPQGDAAGGRLAKPTHRLPRPASGMTDPLPPFPKKHKPVTAGPKIFIGFLVLAGAAVLYFNLRPAGTTVFDRLTQLGSVFGLGGNGDREDTAPEVSSRAARDRDVAANGDGKRARPAPTLANAATTADAANAASEDVAAAERATVLKETAAGIKACYLGAGLPVPAKLQLDLHAVHGRQRVQHPDKLGKAKSCVVTIVESALTDSVRGPLQYDFAPAP